MTRHRKLNDAGSCKKQRDDELIYGISRVENEVTREYINKRVCGQMYYYRSASKRCKARFGRISIITIILTALIPVLTLVVNYHFMIAVAISAIGAAVAGLNTYMSLKDDKRLWNDYRRTRELLLNTLHLYFNNAGVFAAANSQKDRDRLLVETCEGILIEEVSNWSENLRQHKPYPTDSKTTTIIVSDGDK